MARINLTSILSGYLSADVLNEVLAEIEEAFDRAVLKDGESPNAMTADLDMGGNRLLNVASSFDDPTSVPTIATITDYLDSRATGYVSQKIESHTATASQQVFTLTTMTYQVGANNLAVYVNGIRKFKTFDYTETDESTVTFLAGLALNDKVQFLTNTYLATVSIPEHQHAWTELTGLPSYATRWPTWDEVADKPSTFTPTAHLHSAADITAGRLADAQRGVHVQATQPTSPAVGDLWFW